MIASPVGALHVTLIDLAEQVAGDMRFARAVTVLRNSGPRPGRPNLLPSAEHVVGQPYSSACVAENALSRSVSFRNTSRSAPVCADRNRMSPRSHR